MTLRYHCRMDPLGAAPPDDTGTETFRRYLYQASLAVPFCIKCAAGEGVVSVIMEHFEDLVVEYEDSWLFIQIKTRNANRGPWRLSDALGGLKSLHRVFQETRHLEARYDLYLEGPVDPADTLKDLAGDVSDLSQTLRGRVKDHLEIDASECDEFLASVTVRPEQPPRDYVGGRNIRILNEYAPRLLQIELEAVHERVTQELQRAMARERVVSLMPRYIENPDALQEDERSKVEAKRLTKDVLFSLMESVVSGSYLLRSAGAHEAETSKLEEKLVAGGADASIVNDAKMLRANATIRESEFLSSTLYGTEKIEDVRMRLRVFAGGTVSGHSGESLPARRAWADLVTNLPTRAADLDPHRVYHRDAMLLLGAVCGMSDECLVRWGGPADA